MTAVSAGVYHNCALISGGTAECWGRNPVGSIGDGTTSDRAFPVVVQNDAGTGPLSGVTQISAGADVTCALLVDASVHRWGDNFYGELGSARRATADLNGSPCSTLPVAVKDTAGTGTLSGVTKISAGQGFAWRVIGQHDRRLLATAPSNRSRVDPVRMRRNRVRWSSTERAHRFRGITDISAGRDHSCALIVDGTARCWGHNFDGELGNNGSGDGYATVLNSAGSAPLGNITKIAAGYRQTCAVLGDQTARCWGYNYDGELGNGGSGNTDVRRRLPVTVISDTTNTALTGVDDIVTGSDHGCALLSDNTARCWGSNGWLQLGNGDLLVPGNCTSTQAPCGTKATLVRDAAGTALNGISEVSAGMGYDTCARLSDGTAKCWGQNTYNEIGDGTAVHRCVPAAVGVQGPLPQAPGAPTGVSATKAVDKAIVHWAKQPGDCGTPVTKFTVTVSPGGQHIDYSGWTNGVYATSGEFEITPGHPYTFTVTGTNDAGTSPPSAKTNSVVALGEPAPRPASPACPGARTRPSVGSSRRSRTGSRSLATRSRGCATTSPSTSRSSTRRRPTRSSVGSSRRRSTRSRLRRSTATGRARTRRRARQFSSARREHRPASPSR